MTQLPPKRLWALAVSSIVLTGCSLVAVNGPPRVDPGGRLPPQATCTSDLVVPRIDLVGAGLVGAFSASLFLRHGSEGSAGKAGLSALIWSGTLGLSGIVGLRRVQACRAIRDRESVLSDTVPVESMLAPIRVPVDGRRLFDPGEEEGARSP
ncbi:MAG: hypothetical protein F4X13_08250 [Gammaproteobacteria bacterium]|nr:hypothetical protein [Gammaproteobacteria bacterium]